MISDFRTEYGISHRVSCRALGVSESWFYKHRTRRPTRREVRRRRLVEAVREEFIGFRYDGRIGDALCGMVLPFAVTNDVPDRIPKSGARTVRYEVAVTEGAHAAALQK
ncbi:hypothetical protein [Streptomyces phaeochromogenes]|uniref:hypothetical protein n=1 Tax=Streptomyces phaeochromogenes TaxID=1923 RepID=UPI0038698FAF|nr:hypothetical protein OG277_41760 [Streptomyces phaeochromogenes]